MRGFDFPDVVPVKDASVWATWIPFRTPEFKVHRTEGLANSAMSNRGMGESFAKYYLDAGQWTLVFSYNPPELCACGRHYQGHYYRNPEQSKTPKWKQTPLCDVCYDTARAKRRELDREMAERKELARLSKLYNN